MTLKEIRKQRHLTLQQAANGMGINYTALSKIERGQYKPSRKMRKKILDFYGISSYTEILTPEETIVLLKTQIENLQHENETLYGIINDIKKIIRDL